MVRIVWSRNAIDDVELIRNYIRQLNPGASDKLATRLIAAGNNLDSFPNRGRPSSNGCREFAALSPYLIRYEVDGQLVRILRVRHAARPFHEI